MAWDGTAETLAKAITDAAILCATNGEENLFPDTVWLGLTAYGALAGLSDANGRPLFPNLTPSNAHGDRGRAGEPVQRDGTPHRDRPLHPAEPFLVGPADQAEFYETTGAPVQLSVVDVGVAGYNVGVIGMWAAAAVDPHAFAKVTGPTLPPAAEGESRSSSTSSRK